MKRFVPSLVIVAVLVVGVGFFRGWFTVSSQREPDGRKVDVHLSVDTEKVREDVEAVEEKASELAKEVSGEATKLKNQVNGHSKGQ